jgi:hypothetical protein
MTHESLVLCRIAVCYAQGTRPSTHKSCGRTHTAGYPPKTLGIKDKEKEKRE